MQTGRSGNLTMTNSRTFKDNLGCVFWIALQASNLKRACLYRLSLPFNELAELNSKEFRNLNLSGLYAPEDYPQRNYRNISSEKAPKSSSEELKNSEE